MDFLTNKVNSFKRTIQTDPMTQIMNDPVKKARITPEFLRCLSIGGMSYFALTTLLMLLSSVFLFMPTIYQGGDYWLSLTLALAAFAQVITNFLMVSTRKGFYNGCPRELGVIPDPSWKKCLDCDHQIPPRVHHCGLCGRCVLGRDHHCFFTGSCVGSENHRFFVVFTFYCSVAAGYSTYLTLLYLDTEHIHPINGLLHFFPPIAALEWMFGYASFTFLYTVIILTISYVTSLGSVGIFLWQMLLVSQNCTMFDYSQRTSGFKWNILYNFRAVFGPYWGLGFLFPMPCISSPAYSLKDSDSKLT